MKYNYDYDEPEITKEDKECAYISFEITFECEESAFSIITACVDDLFEHHNCFDINEEDFNDDIIAWFKENNFKYLVEFEDEYEYDSYEYPIGFENLVRHCYFTFTMSDTALVAFKMRWL